MTRRIYMAGCGGMLGEAFQKTFTTDSILKCTDIDTNEPWLTYLDFRDLDAYRKDVKEFKPDCLFHLGAHTDLEFCELHPDDAYLTNTIAVEMPCSLRMNCVFRSCISAQPESLMASRTCTMTGINLTHWATTRGPSVPVRRS